MKTLAILTNGGDTPSLNAVIRTVRDNALAAGFTRVLGFEEGYLGIVETKVKLLTWESIDPLQGGTILRSQRSSPTSDEEKEAVFNALKELEVSLLVTVGGDGSLAAARDLLSWEGAKTSGIRILGFPRTIDNDIRTGTFDGRVEVALCPGFPSAAFKTARLAKELRTTAMSSRKVFVLEVMGRDAGWLAASATLGGAEVVLVPEVDLTNDDWERLLRRIAKLYDLHGHAIIAVSEGFRLDGEQEMDSAFGPRKLGGIGVRVAKKLEQELKPAYPHLQVRYQQAGYIPRMGGPTDYDIELAQALGREIGLMLQDGSNGELPVISHVVGKAGLVASTSRMPLGRIAQFLFPARDFYDEAAFTVSPACIDFMRKFVDLTML